MVIFVIFYLFYIYIKVAMGRFKTNVMIFLVAVLLSVVLFYFTENPVFFSASILSLQDSKTMEANAWDIWYKNEKKVLDVFLADWIKDINYVSLSIIYDESDVSFDINDISTQVDYEILSNTPGVIVLKFTKFSWDYHYKQSLFELPYNSNMPSILISEWIVALLNWENKSLSIWFLNQVSDDWNH